MATSVNFLRAKDGAAITPDDGIDLARAADAIYFGGEGAVQIDTLNGNTLLFPTNAAGSILPVAAKRVYATNTTATDLIALYE